MNSLYDGISFNGKHSWRDYRMYLSTAPDFGTPEAKTDYVDIPGRDGVLDFTEAATGEVKYSNREMVFTFARMIAPEYREQFRSELRNDLHGKTAEIIYDLDADWYYTGRCSVAFEDVMPWKMKIVITVDAAPYKLARNNTIITVEPTSFASETVELGRGTESQHHNTIFTFGTASTPKLDLTMYSTLVFLWPDSGVWGTPTLQIIDSAGQTYNGITTINDYIDGMGATVLDVDDISGITKSNVYRILCQNRSMGILRGTTIASSTVIMPVDRMTVCPKWTVDDGESTALTIKVQTNGRIYTLPEGTSYEYNLTLKEGAQEVTFFSDSDDVTITAEYQDGRL